MDPSVAEELQRHLLSHLQAGVGPPLRREHVRAMMAARVSSLVRGRSGVRREIVDLLVGMLRQDVVPSVGTVGASGGLTPLAHMAATLSGEGAVWFTGECVAAADGLSRAGLTALVF